MIRCYVILALDDMCRLRLLARCACCAKWARWSMKFVGSPWIWMNAWLCTLGENSTFASLAIFTSPLQIPLRRIKCDWWSYGMTISINSKTKTKTNKTKILYSKTWFAWWQVPMVWRPYVNLRTMVSKTTTTDAGLTAWCKPWLVVTSLSKPCIMLKTKTKRAKCS